MMESAHSPGDTLTPNDEDPFKSVSSSNLDDLALDDDEIDETDGAGDAYKQIHVAPLTDDDLDTLSHDIPPSSTSALPSEPIQNSPSIQDEEDPWAVLAAAAGNTTARGASVSASAATVPSSNLTSRDALASERPDPSSPTTVTYSHAQGENFSIDTAAPVSSNNDRDRPPHPRLPAELATLSKHIQTSAAHLGDVLSTTLRDVDEKNELSAKVLPRVKSNFETTTKSIDEKIHVSETWEGFKTRVWKPTAEKVAPKVKDRWGVVSQSVVGWKEKMGRGPASDAEGSAGEGDGGRHMDDLERYARGDEEFSNAEASLADESAPAAASSPSPPSGNTHAAPTQFVQSIGQLGQKAQQLKWNEKWASISSTVGNKWQSAAAELEQWKEEQKKKMDSEHSEGNAGPFDPNSNDGGYDSHSDPVSAKVRESLKGGMGWVSKRFKEVKFQKEQGASDYHGPRPGTEMQDMSMDRETKRLDSDGLPSSFFKE